ncbi:MAG: helix-turn-helix transcriptional regulator [Anaerolineales bacterium]
MCNNHHGPGGCRHRGGLLRGFVRPRLLLQLAKEPSHGYELLEVLGEKDLPTPDPSTLYRALNQFEEEGLVSSSWDTQGGGPARRVYQLTNEGMEHLRGWVINIQRTRDQLDEFLDAYQAHTEKERN